MVEETTQAPRLTARGRATRARILDAAADLILKHGVTGTQIDDVRRAAGVSGSQMAHYFKDKRTLIREVIAWQAQATLDKHQQPALGHLDSFEALRLWSRMNQENQRQLDYVGGCQFGSLAGQLAESDDETRTDLACGFQQWLELFRKGLLAMRERGDLRHDADPEALAHAILGALQGGMLLSQTLRRPEPLRDSLNAVLGHVESYATDNR